MAVHKLVVVIIVGYKEIDNDINEKHTVDENIQGSDISEGRVTHVYECNSIRCYCEGVKQEHHHNPFPNVLGWIIGKKNTPPVFLQLP